MVRSRRARYLARQLARVDWVLYLQKPLGQPCAKSHKL